MKLEEIMEETWIDKAKSLLGHVKGKIVSSVGQLLMTFKKKPTAQLTTIGKFSIPSLNLRDVPTRVDTGAASCSLHATDVKIDGDDVSFKTVSGSHKAKLKSTVTVKNSNGSSSVPKVELDVEWNGKKYKTEVKLSDRSKLKFKFLVGRNLIIELKTPVSIDPEDDLGD